MIGSEFVRTPIIAFEELKRKKDDNLVKKLADKLISTAISKDDDDKDCEDKITMKKAKKNKNLIYEDEENTDRYSTPPKKAVVPSIGSSRTPLSCVANTTPKTRSLIPTSTPKSKMPFADENQKSLSRIPVSARRLH